MDLILRNGILASAPGRSVDIGIAGGRIAGIGSGLPEVAEAVDLGGRLIMPGFVETHIHLDKSCILDRCNADGALDEAIAEVARLKADFTAEDVAARAGRTIRKAIVNGTTAMRTHVEVDPVIGLRGLDGVEQAARDHAWAIDVEICVFPQEGMLNRPGTEELILEGLRRGARVVGAAPYTDSDPHGQIDRIFEIARDFDVDIDMHLDFSADPASLDVDQVCRRTEEYGWGGRVAVGHVTKLAFLPPARFERVAKTMAGAGVAVTVLPATDIFLIGREHTHAAPRGLTAAHRLLTHGVNCSLSTNNVLNPFTPFGDGSLIRIANLYANLSHIGGRAGLAECMSMITDRSAKLLNRAGYGVAVGNAADLVVIDAADPAMAVAEIAQPILGFKNGRRTFSRPLPELHHPG